MQWHQCGICHSGGGARICKPVKAPQAQGKSQDSVYTPFQDAVCLLPYPSPFPPIFPSDVSRFSEWIKSHNARTFTKNGTKQPGNVASKAFCLDSIFQSTDSTGLYKSMALLQTRQLHLWVCGSKQEGKSVCESEYLCDVSLQHKDPGCNLFLGKEVAKPVIPVLKAANCPA